MDHITLSPVFYSACPDFPAPLAARSLPLPHRAHQHSRDKTGAATEARFVSSHRARHLEPWMAAEQGGQACAPLS